MAISKIQFLKTQFLKSHLLKSHSQIAQITLKLNCEELLLGTPSLSYIVELIKQEEIKFQKNSVELLVTKWEREREREREREYGDEMDEVGGGDMWKRIQRETKNLFTEWKYNKRKKMEVGAVGDGEWKLVDLFGNEKSRKRFCSKILSEWSDTC